MNLNHLLNSTDTRGYICPHVVELQDGEICLCGFRAASRRLFNEHRRIVHDFEPVDGSSRDPYVADVLEDIQSTKLLGGHLDDTEPEVQHDGESQYDELEDESDELEDEDDELEDEADLRDQYESEPEYASEGHQMDSEEEHEDEDETENENRNEDEEYEEHYKEYKEEHAPENHVPHSSPETFEVGDDLPDTFASRSSFAAATCLDGGVDDVWSELGEQGSYWGPSTPPQYRLRNDVTFFVDGVPISPTSSLADATRSAGSGNRPKLPDVEVPGPDAGPSAIPMRNVVGGPVLNVAGGQTIQGNYISGPFNMPTHPQADAMFSDDFARQIFALQKPLLMGYRARYQPAIGCYTVLRIMYVMNGQICQAEVELR